MLSTFNVRIAGRIRRLARVETIGIDISKSYPIGLDMRFWRKESDRVLVVGIFQSVGTARAVLQNLHRALFRRVGAVHASAKGRQRVEEYRISAIGGSAAASVLSLALGAFVLWQRGVLAYYRSTGLVLLLATFTLVGAITGWILVQLFQEHVHPTNLARFRSTIPAE